MSSKAVVTLLLSLTILTLVYLSYEAFIKHSETVNSLEKDTKPNELKDNKRVNVIVFLPPTFKPIQKSELDPRPKFPLIHSPLFNDPNFDNVVMKRPSTDNENNKESGLFKLPSQTGPSKPDESFQKRNPDLLFNKSITFSPFPSHVDHEMTENN